MNDYEKSKNKQNYLRQELQNLLKLESVNIILDSIDIFFSIFLITQYICGTYDHIYWDNEIWKAFNLLVHCYMLCEWMIKLYTVKSMTQYLGSLESLVQMFTLVPFFTISISIIHIESPDRLAFLQLANLLCLLRILDLNRCRSYMDSEVNKQLLSIVLSITALIVTAAACLHFNCQFQPINNKLQFHYFIYFVMTTISTMGYSNPFPSVESRILIIILIAFAFFFVPAQSGKLIRHMSSKSLYARNSYKASEAISHIVIMGTISTIALENFIKELFHQDHGQQKLHLVLLVPHLPEPLLESLIRLPEYEANVIYIQGDPLSDKDLKRCQIEKAKVIILMCNKQSADANAEDSKTILLAMVIKKYLKQHGQNNTRFCMQILRFEGKTHYYLSLNKQTKQDQVICIEELKMSLLAKSCLCPGLITVISNLITSSGDPPDPETLPYNWLHQYWTGQGFEIYKTNLPVYFRDKTFSHSVLLIYREFEAVLFGIELITNGNSRIYLNPGNMRLPDVADTKIMGYIISQDKSVADDITLYKVDEDDGKQVINYQSRIPFPQTSLLGRVSGYFRNNTQEDNIVSIDVEKETRNNIPNLLKNNRSQIKWQQPIQGGWIKMMTQNKRKVMGHKAIYKTLHQQDQEVDNENDNEFGQDGISNRNGFQANPKLEKKFKNFMQSDVNHISQQSHMTNERVSLKDVTFKTLEDSILATNHVILCGMVSNLINFVLPLRAKYLSTYPPIVILNDHEPTEKQWNQICYFPEIYFVNGTALVQRDLLRANLIQASKVVILSPRVEEISKATFDDADAQNYLSEEATGDASRGTQQLSRDQQDLLDARTIFKYRNVIGMKPNIQIVTELVSPQNLSFLVFDKDYALMKKYQSILNIQQNRYGFNHTPIFASGQIYLSSVMDSLLCQAYYNPALITVLYKLLVGSASQPQAKDLWDEVQPSNIFHIHVPKAFLHKSFEKLFLFMVKEKFIIPLALYRLSGSQDNKQPFIWTNPEQSTILNERDLILILSQEHPPKDYSNWGGPLEVRVQNNEQDQPNHQNSNDSSTNEEPEIMLLNEENDKETQKVKIFNHETENVILKIQQTFDQIFKLKTQTENLEKLLSHRQDGIIGKMKDIVKDELSNVIAWKKKENEYCDSENY